VTTPEVTIWVPTIERISVLLPHPDGPSNPVMVPRAIRTETSCSAVRLPRTTVRCSIVMADPSSWINSSCDEVIM
jgi:hypothetical protein